jgi:hypothetical protein
VIQTTDRDVDICPPRGATGKGAAAALPNDAMKIVARGAGKEDRAATA